MTKKIYKYLDEDLKFKEVALLMKCIESYEQTHT